MKNLIVLLLLFLSPFLKAQNNTSNVPKKMENQFVGTWDLVTVVNTNADGSEIFPYGEKPVGQLIFTKEGQYSVHIMKGIRPKVVANDKNKATPEENAALVQGNNSHFGTYTIDANNKTISFNIEHAFYPNWEGNKQIRSFTLVDSILTYIVTQTTNGGAITAKVVWERRNP